ncbi:conjugal transfer protein TraB [Ancylobacter sp. VNQ12]|uniref:conjugal transfer protein TraB n=1 Tax=Ancylobacter sp. VNQ12 TaxID=3400920 RepID=UPI003C0FA53C
MACSVSPAHWSPSILERWRSPILVLAAVVVGAVGWSGHVLTLPVALLFPVLWSSAPSRMTVGLISAGYFLAASRGLPQGVATFFASDFGLGLLLWVGASLSFVVVQAALWMKRPGTEKGLRFLLATALMAAPPFGITGWAQPVTAAGVLFPGWSWWGLAATVIGLVLLTTDRWRSALFVLYVAWPWSAVIWVPPIEPAKWKAVDLDLGRSLGRDLALERQRELVERARLAAAEVADVVVLPESALGFWTPTVERLWHDEFGGGEITVVAGAAIVDDKGYDNAIVAISAAGSQILYRERMPVPVSMWQPWRALTGHVGGARANFFANPVVELAGARIAPLICYEQLLVWPILQSMLHAPDVVIGVGNAWWTAGSSITDIQRASLTAWASLFGLPLVVALNT